MDGQAMYDGDYIYKNYKQLIYNRIRKIGSSVDLEDAFQSVFMNILEHLPIFDIRKGNITIFVINHIRKGILYYQRAEMKWVNNTDSIDEAEKMIEVIDDYSDDEIDWPTVPPELLLTVYFADYTTDEIRDAYPDLLK